MLLFALPVSCSAQESQSTYFGFEHELEQRMATIGDDYERLVASCVSASGHIELEEVRQPGTGSNTNPAAHSGMVFWHPLETGPTTMAEAETFGLRGVSLAFQQTSGDVIVGSNLVYDRTLRSCRESVDKKTNAAITETLKKWVGDYSEVRRSFIDWIEPVAKPVSETQLLCFAREAGIAEDVVMLLDRDAMLDHIGIGSGLFSQQVPPELPAGEIAIYPRSPATYSPPAAEIDLAKHFVNCAQRTNLVERILEVQRVPRKETLAEFEDLLTSYRNWANDAETALTAAIPETGLNDARK